MSLSTENIEKFNSIHSHSDKTGRGNEELKSHTTTDLDVLHVPAKSFEVELQEPTVSAC